MVPSTSSIEIGLHGAVVAVDEEVPLVLTVSNGANASGLQALPFGPFDPIAHRTMEAGLRLWVKEQTNLPLGYVEQLYTFGDRDRLKTDHASSSHLVSVGYLALVRKPQQHSRDAILLSWDSWYRFFPWEDWRSGQPTLLNAVILPALLDWMRGANSADERNAREARIRLEFGCEITSEEKAVINAWDEERVLERYELMYSAGIIQEAITDGRRSTLRVTRAPGQSMLHDHRRILATAMARLRAKLKYRPVVFELLPEQFTLTELQRTVETLSGHRLHKQNFRRMVEKANLVEATGATASQTGGRPAAYFKFRRAITRERPTPGLRVSSKA